MFNPREWLQLAESLAERADEASLRTAVNRMYYGAFLRNRMSLEANELLTPSGDAKDHRLVARTLNQRRRPRAGSALNSLYRLRERADYEPDEELTHDDYLDALADVEEIVRACSADWEKDPLPFS